MQQSTNIAASLRATTLNNLGTVCSKQGKHEESLGSCRRRCSSTANTIWSPGKDGLPDLHRTKHRSGLCAALALHNLGVQQECLGDAEAAKETFRRSKFIVQKALDAARANESHGYAGSTVTNNSLRGIDVELASVSSRSRCKTVMQKQQQQQRSKFSSSLLG